MILTVRRPTRVKLYQRLIRNGILLLSAALSASAAIIPDQRVTDWRAGINVGVPGGIDQYLPGGANQRTTLIDVTASPYNADKTGSQDATAAIQSAINAAKSGQVVYLPAGRYRLNGSLDIGPSRDGITLRGAGMDATILDSRQANKAITVGSSSDYRWDYPSTNNIVTGGQTKGSTVLTIGETRDFEPGQILNFAIADQTDNAAIRGGAAPTVNVSGWSRSQHQMVRLVSKTATTLTIFPALYSDYQSRQIKVTRASFQTDFAGIEDLTIDCSNGPTVFGIYFEQTYACWIKNVKVTKSQNYGFSIANSVQSEIRGCFADQRATNGTNGGGILVGLSSGCLVEDNIVYKFFPLLEVNAGCSGNVFAYNFFYDSSVFGVNGVGINTNHGPHNAFNLYEGNIGSTLQCDGYFGSASEDTIFRNFLHGTNPGISSPAHSIVLNRFTRNYNIVGNQLGMNGGGSGLISFGNPNLGNGSSTGTAKPTENRFWADWKMTATLSTRTSDNAGTLTLNNGSLNTFQFVTIWWDNGMAQFTPATVSGSTITFGSSGNPLPPPGTSVTVWSGPSGFQELDLDVEATALIKSNSYAGGANSAPGGEVSLGSGEALPPSLYRTSKPAFFGSLSWPPFDPSNRRESFEAIPAGYRYFHAAPPPPGAATPPTGVRIIRQ